MGRTPRSATVPTDRSDHAARGGARVRQLARLGVPHRGRGDGLRRDAEAKAWETCQVDALNDFQKKQRTTARASIETREASELGQNHFESFAAIKLVDPAKPDKTVGNYVVRVFRWGQVVTTVISEQQYLSPAVQTTFDAQSYEALSKQFARVDAATAAG